MGKSSVHGLISVKTEFFYSHYKVKGKFAFHSISIKIDGDNVKLSRVTLPMNTGLFQSSLSNLWKAGLCLKVEPQNEIQK